METVRLGAVGLGWFGGVLAEAARASGEAEVVTCFARSEEGRKAFAEAHGCEPAESLESLLGDPSIHGVIVATPHSTHGGLIEQAAAAGKHVFVEKPLALTIEDARRAIDAAERAGVTLQVGHNRRRQPANRRIRSMIESGELGTVMQLEGFHSSPGAHKLDLPAWRTDPSECPAGGMTALGVHTVDTYNYLVGPAARLFAFSKKVAGVSTLDEATAVTIEYQSGPIGQIGTSYFVPGLVSLAVYGTDLNVWNEEDGARLFTQARADKARAEQAVEQIDTIRDEVVEFARCIRDGGTPETGAAEGLEVAVVLEGIAQSVESGRAIDLTALR
ncbi:MAG: Gfo/Idh/MocA family oxidoreductase [Actinomycetota bacterium]